MEACKQSGRRRLPSVALGAIDTPRQDVLAVVLATGAGVPSLGKVLAGRRVEEVWIAVGPEGGFSERELARLSAGGWRDASLGPAVLRTETAGAIAAAIVLTPGATWAPPVDSPRRQPMFRSDLMTMRDGESMELHINDLLKICSDRGASDLHLKAGSHPVIRVDGRLLPLTDQKRLMQEDTIAMAFSIMSARQKQKFKDNFELDMAYSVPGLGRSAAASSSSAGRSARPARHPRQDPDDPRSVAAAGARADRRRASRADPRDRDHRFREVDRRSPR
jgi:hypothetical protein